jgi:hypothetical protein
MFFGRECCRRYEFCRRRWIVTGRQTDWKSWPSHSRCRDHVRCHSATLSRVRWQGRCFPIGSDVIADANAVSETLSSRDCRAGKLQHYRRCGWWVLSTKTDSSIAAMQNIESNRRKTCIVAPLVLNVGVESLEFSLHSALFPTCLVIVYEHRSINRISECRRDSPSDPHRIDLRVNAFLSFKSFLPSPNNAFLR